MRRAEKEQLGADHVPNGWGGKLSDVLLPYLSAAQPDVLCLQEIVHSPQTDHDWLINRDGDHVLPQRANFMRYVCLALPDRRNR
ncbi:hypothetical protein ACERZ8_12845 [Tateyamaria armeniaca]|uniref:Endonuclease/exonuclease/phosphatase domain-containing protein n=1 Tax=Tateyamaria armeniaca TaxID=2518930 RepID=A0ABW8UXT8_9RHOB